MTERERNTYLQTLAWAGELVEDFQTQFTNPESDDHMINWWACHDAQDELRAVMEIVKALPINAEGAAVDPECAPPHP